MHFSAIKDCDIANGPGVRVTLFVSGCTNHCEHCFQPQTWDFDYGEPFTEETEEQLLRMLQPAYVRGLTLLGGEPMEPSNQRSLLPFVQKVRTVFSPRRGISITANPLPWKPKSSCFVCCSPPMYAL